MVRIHVNPEKENRQQTDARARYQKAIVLQELESPLKMLYKYNIQRYVKSRI